MTVISMEATDKEETIDTTRRESIQNNTTIVEATTTKEETTKTKQEITETVQTLITDKINLMKTRKEDKTDLKDKIVSMTINTKKDKIEEEVEAETLTTGLTKIEKNSPKIERKIPKTQKKMLRTRKDHNKQETMETSHTKDANTETNEEVTNKTGSKVATMTTTKTLKTVQRKSTSRKMTPKRNKSSSPQSLRKKRRSSSQITLMICLMWTAMTVKRNDSQPKGSFSIHLLDLHGDLNH
jgi:hypothetical protein